MPGAIVKSALNQNAPNSLAYNVTVLCLIYYCRSHGSTLDFFNTIGQVLPFQTFVSETKSQGFGQQSGPPAVLLNKNCAVVGIQSCDRVKGTKRTGITERVFVCPGAIFSTTVSCCMADASPSGMTSRPPTLSCSISGGGTCPSAAVTTIASNGPHSGQP